MAESPSDGLRGASILVADDDRLSRETLVRTLRAQGCTVEAVEDGQAAIEAAARGNFDLAMLDVVMPRMTGLDACRVIKGITRNGFLPIILVTVRSDTASRVEGLRIGADDYVSKPFDEEELVARIEAMLRIKRLHDEVHKARAKLEQLQIHDELTGLFSYRHLHSRLSEEFKRAERQREPLATAVIDVDGLGRMNEVVGRDFGDRVIKGIAAVILKTVRETDVAARYGGGQFLLALTNTHFAGSVTVAERVWREVGDKSFIGDPARGVRPTLSIGIALYPSRDVRTKDALLRAADAALTRAKRDGGNRICVFQQQGYVYTPLSGDAPVEPRPAGPTIEPRPMPTTSSRGSSPAIDRGSSPAIDPRAGGALAGRTPTAAPGSTPPASAPAGPGSGRPREGTGPSRAPGR